MKVWVMKDVLLQRTHSARLRGWATTSHNVWVPGTLQAGRTIGNLYEVRFTPEKGFSPVAVQIPCSAINVDSNITKRMIHGGLPLLDFLKIQEILRHNLKAEEVHEAGAAKAISTCPITP